MHPGSLAVLLIAIVVLPSCRNVTTPTAPLPEVGTAELDNAAECRRPAPRPVVPTLEQFEAELVDGQLVFTAKMGRHTGRLGRDWTFKIWSQGPDSRAIHGPGSVGQSSRARDLFVSCGGRIDDDFYCSTNPVGTARLRGQGNCLVVVVDDALYLSNRKGIVVIFEGTNTGSMAGASGPMIVRQVVNWGVAPALSPAPAQAEEPVALRHAGQR